MGSTSEDKGIRRLLDVGRSLVGELDPKTVLDRVLEEARAITGARYAALGVLNDSRTELKQFLTAGIDPATHRAIGELPHGRGVLGALIVDPRPLRLRDVGEHPQSYGFPSSHPAMHAFLGVPILIRGEAWGNLYLTEKENGEEFTAEDEDAVLVLARWAATAIENARLYEHSERRRQQAERAVRSLETARDIADAVGGMEELDRVLELIVKRGRALVDARTVLIMLRDGDQLVVAASAGHAANARGIRVPVDGSTSGQVLARGHPERITDVKTRLRITPERLGVPDAHTALLVPMIHRGVGVGVLAAFDRGDEGEPFSNDDEQLLRTFAASAANAVALRRSVEADRLRSAIAAADEERSRWARELHDETLQALGGLRVLLAAALRRGDPAGREEAMRQAIEDIEHGIENLRGIISDLRPSLLDDLGLAPAIEALLDRRRQGGIEIEGDVRLAPNGHVAALSPALQTTIYRLVQESLTNVVKHSGAAWASVSVRLAEGCMEVEVQDNGVGFDPDQRTSGFGLAGMRERVYLAGGTLEIGPANPGTRVFARFPAAETEPSAADQAVS